MNGRTELQIGGTIRVDDKNKYLENHYASTGIASLTGNRNNVAMLLIFKRSFLPMLGWYFYDMTFLFCIYLLLFKK